jgi:hypothetical protein
MGGYTSKCEKSQNHCTLMLMDDVDRSTVRLDSVLDPDSWNRDLDTDPAFQVNPYPDPGF